VTARRLLAGRVSWVLAILLALLAAASSPAGAQGPPAPAEHPPLAFSWTLLPGMWVEIDLRMAEGSEAVADFTATSGEIRWDLHVHPLDAPPSTFLVIERGTGTAGRLRFAPDAAGRYSYRWEHPTPDGVVRLRVTLTLRGEARVDAVKP
jgi:hypothetical protein